ncbi:hypothetical protein [Thioalkalivibrio thiocyanodenitrificans]|uniref:hypothetical protein n=1 Tax=Thioalkalivibrio thiocyanodenitrificans TaxID=243063 RepID=UPI0012EAB60B|nr:hypothetical protein [Thioalkalivibrio thiocyanodenitrificans]
MSDDPRTPRTAPCARFSAGAGRNRIARWLATPVLPFVFLLAAVFPLSGQGQDTFVVNHGQISTGATLAGSTSFQAFACIAEPVGGLSSSTSYQVLAGCGAMLVSIAQQSENGGNGGGRPGAASSPHAIPVFGTAGWIVLAMLLAATALVARRRTVLP